MCPFLWHPFAPIDVLCTLLLQSIALGELVAKRLEATARLQACLNDVVAMETLAEVEEKASRWCQSLVKPGQFTGAQLVRPMSMKEHQVGHQAWVTKVCGCVCVCVVCVCVCVCGVCVCVCVVCVCVCMRVYIYVCR